MVTTLYNITNGTQVLGVLEDLRLTGAHNIAVV